MESNDPVVDAAAEMIQAMHHEEEDGVKSLDSS